MAKNLVREVKENDSTKSPFPLGAWTNAWLYRPTYRFQCEEEVHRGSFDRRRELLKSRYSRHILHFLFSFYALVPYIIYY